VVLTTYAIIEAEHRRYMMPGKVQCRYCKGKFYPDRLRLHLKCAVGACLPSSMQLRPRAASWEHQCWLRSPMMVAYRILCAAMSPSVLC